MNFAIRYYFCTIFMSLILKVNSNVINYSLVNYEDDESSKQVFMNLATGAYLLSSREPCQIIAIDDHTFKFTDIYGCNVSFSCHDGYEIWIKDDASLTIDEDSLLNSVLDIYVDKNVSVINSTIIADTNFYADCNIVNSFAYICNPVYNELNIVNERFFTNEQDFEQYLIKPKEDETMIVISGNTFKYCEEYSDSDVIVLRNTNEYSCEEHVKYKYAGIVIYNVKHFHLVETSCFIKYIVLIGDSNMHISRVNLMQFENDVFNKLEAKSFTIARNFAENFSKESVKYFLEKATKRFSKEDIEYFSNEVIEHFSEELADMSSKVLRGPFTEDEEEIIRVSMDIFPNAVKEHVKEHFPNAAITIPHKYLEMHVKRAVLEFRNNFRPHLINENMKKLIHDAEDTKQSDLVNKYHPKFNVTEQGNRFTNNHYERKHVLTYNPKLINVKYSNNVLAGFEYLEQNKDEDIQDVDLFDACDLQTVPLINVEKGAKLFMLYDVFDDMIYHVDVKSNAIITLCTSCYYEEGYITYTFVPNMLMKMIMDHTCMKSEDLSNDFNYVTIYTVRKFLEMMNEDAS